MKQYSVDSKIKQLSRGELFLILLIFLCAIRIVFNAVRNTYSFNDPFQYLDYLIFLILALGSLYLVLRKKLITKIRGSYIRTDTDQFSFKSRGVEKEFKDFRLIKAIQFPTNAILVTDICDSQYTIFLDDFINPDERQEIIAYFEKVLDEVNESLK